MNRVKHVGRRYEAAKPQIDAERARKKLVRGIASVWRQKPKKDLMAKAKELGIRGRTTVPHEELVQATAEGAVRQMIKRATSA